METKKTVSLLLIRHGQAQSNVSKILTSYPEVRPMPLSQRGRREVLATAHALSGITVSAIFASPLTRTQETAALIQGVVPAPLITDHRLRETDFGIYNNTSYTQFFLRYPHPSLREEMNTETQAEGLFQVRERTKNFLRFLWEEYQEKTVVVVTHADVIREIHTLLNPKERRWSSVPTGSMHPVTLTSAANLD